MSSFVSLDKFSTGFGGLVRLIDRRNLSDFFFIVPGLLGLNTGDPTGTFTRTFGQSNVILVIHITDKKTYGNGVRLARSSVASVLDSTRPDGETYKSTGYISAFAGFL